MSAFLCSARSLPGCTPPITEFREAPPSRSPSSSMHHDAETKDAANISSRHELSNPSADAALQRFTVVTVVHIADASAVAPSPRHSDVSARPAPLVLPSYLYEPTPLPVQTEMREIPDDRLPSVSRSQSSLARVSCHVAVTILAGTLLVAQGSLSLSDQALSSSLFESRVFSISSIAFGALVLIMALHSARRSHATVAPAPASAIAAETARSAPV